MRRYLLFRNFAQDILFENNMAEELGFSQVALVADSAMPHLISLYESVGFLPAGHCHAFGVDFQRMTVGIMHLND